MKRLNKFLDEIEFSFILRVFYMEFENYKNNLNYIIDSHNILPFNQIEDFCLYNKCR